MVFEDLKVCLRFFRVCLRIFGMCLRIFRCV